MPAQTPKAARAAAKAAPAPKTPSKGKRAVRVPDPAFPTSFDVTARLGDRQVGFTRDGRGANLDGGFFDLSGRKPVPAPDLDLSFERRPDALRLAYQPDPFGHEVAFLRSVGATRVVVKPDAGAAKGEGPAFATAPGVVQ